MAAAKSTAEAASAAAARRSRGTDRLHVRERPGEEVPRRLAAPVPAGVERRDHLAERREKARRGAAGELAHVLAVRLVRGEDEESFRRELRQSRERERAESAGQVAVLEELLRQAEPGIGGARVGRDALVEDVDGRKRAREREGRNGTRAAPPQQEESRERGEEEEREQEALRRGREVRLLARAPGPAGAEELPDPVRDLLGGAHARRQRPSRRAVDRARQVQEEDALLRLVGRRAPP